MKLLCLVQDYTDLKGKVALHYVHTRNLYYKRNSIEVDVLSFNASNDYVLDEINVLTEENAVKKLMENKYDVVISHAPNLRNHIRFLRKQKQYYAKLIFVFHGHEVLHKSKIYPKPFQFKNTLRTKIEKYINDIYDVYKLREWRKIINEFSGVANYIFVSHWMYDHFLKNTKVSKEEIQDNSHIIYNSIGKVFEENTYNADSEKKYDFITIRNNLDGSKYAIDVVLEIANNHPQYKFCIVGKGEFFEYFKKPSNVVWIDKNLNHREIIDYLNSSKFALLPTRLDAQGVMACEFASFGIPLITSDIDVCKEIFGDFDNVRLIDNESSSTICLEEFIDELVVPDNRNQKYYEENTVSKEVEFIKSLVNS